ncbi:MAG: glycosyltransferase [Akkermansiaceae bacterium]|nr:glycosyltransferase [Armatimonadota bacterium]
MRILHVINDLRLAGAERLLADLATQQRESGMDVSLAPLVACGSAFETNIRDAGVPLLMPDRPHPIRSPSHIARFRRMIGGYDLVHVHLFPAQLWIALAALTQGRSAPILFTTEHNTHNTRRNVRAFRLVDRLMYSKYDHIAAISEGTRDAMATYLPETASKISVVHNGIDPRRFTGSGSPEERACLFPQIPITAPLLLCIGRLEPQKDFPNLLWAFAQVPDAHLAVIGTGPLQAELEALAQTLAIPTRVHFFGRRNDIPALLRNADVYVQASEWEGFGIAAVEAMASGLPLVITDVQGLREVVADAGIRVPRGKPDALADAIRKLLATPAQRQALSKRARERSQIFSIAATADAYKELYERSKKAT